MVSFSEFEAVATVDITEAEFNKIEPRAVELLSSLCSNGDKWDEDSEVCKKAVIYQVEYIVLTGGVSSWLSGSEGKKASHSYSIGGESESVSYMQGGSDKEGVKTYLGLAVSPLAWNLLVFNGFLQLLRGRMVW